MRRTVDESRIVRAAVDRRLTIRDIADEFGVAVSTAHAIMQRAGYEPTRETIWRRKEEES